MTQVITGIALGLVPGDRIKFSGDTNRMRRIVAGIDSKTEFRTLLFVRPSRGWRRHMRRMKQLKRLGAAR